MPRLTRAEAAQLGRRRAQPTKAPGELLAVFVPGRLVNPMNERQDVPWFAGKHARYKRQWKERVALAILEVVSTDRRWKPIDPRTPKRIAFHATVPKALDSIDGLRVAMKAFPDALKDCGVIDDDRDSSGHEFVYTQEAQRKAGTVYGVIIRVALRSEP